MFGANSSHYGILEVYRKIDYPVVNKEKGFMFHRFFFTMEILFETI